MNCSDWYAFSRRPSIAGDGLTVEKPCAAIWRSASICAGTVTSTWICLSPTFVTW
jgi:hypothetical protein